MQLPGGQSLIWILAGFGGGGGGSSIPELGEQRRILCTGDQLQAEEEERGHT